MIARLTRWNDGIEVEPMVLERILFHEGFTLKIAHTQTRFSQKLPFCKMAVGPADGYRFPAKV